MESKSYPQLHPELEQYLESMEHFGKMLRHPLLFAVPYFGEQENERLNTLFELRKAAIAEHIKERDYLSYVFTHERPYRLNALMTLYGNITTEELLPIVLEVYTDSENISENDDDWHLLLEPLTGTDPWGTVHELPDGEFTIYRGGSRDGFSWTLDVDKAKWFANRWNQNLPLWQAVVTRNDVIGYYDHRGEKEVIVNPDDISHLIEPLEM